MALKKTNKNRIKEPLVEAVEDTIADVHESTLAAITELADINKDITKANVLWSVVGVAIGLAILVFII